MINAIWAIVTLKKLANKIILLISELANMRTCSYIYDPYTFASCTEKTC